jgi:hypothetical protein
LSSNLLSKIVNIQIKRTIELKNTPYNLLEIYQHIVVAYCLKLEGSTLEPLKMEAVCSFETKNPKDGGSRFLRNQTTQRRCPDETVKS